MQPIQHQMMGYDRAITMFSPDGRLLQVEYAKKTVKQGSTAIGLVCKDGVILVADKRIVDKLIVPDSVEKIFKIDDHMLAAVAGIVSDGRVLIDRAQVKAQQNKVTFDTPIDTLSVVKDLCSLMQICTQSAGLRPFGVSLLITGIDTDGQPRLFETDPTGIFFEYKASVIGEGETEIEEMLYKEYKDDLTIDEGLTLGIRLLTRALKDVEFNAERIDAVYISSKDKKFVDVPKKKIADILGKNSAPKKSPATTK